MADDVEVRAVPDNPHRRHRGGYLTNAYEDNPRETHDADYNNCDQESSASNEIYHFSNKIILGSKPCPDSTTPEPSTPEPSTPEPSTPEPSTPEPSTPESSTSEPSTSEPSTPKKQNLIILVDDCGGRLESSPRYCKECKTLFATTNALNAHNSSVHLFDSDAIEESITCDHCQRCFKDKNLLIKHLYELVPKVRNNQSSVQKATNLNATAASKSACTTISTTASTAATTDRKTVSPSSSTTATTDSTTVSTTSSTVVSSIVNTIVSKSASTSSNTASNTTLSKAASLTARMTASTSPSTFVSKIVYTNISDAASMTVSKATSTSISTPASTSVRTPVSTSVSTPASTIVKVTIQVKECPICGYCFKYDMKLHLARNHEISCHDELKKVPFNSKCKFCVVVFTTVQAYNKHITMFQCSKSASTTCSPADSSTASKIFEIISRTIANSAACTSVSTAASAPASTSISIPASTPVTTPASTSVRTLARTSFSTPASASVSAPASTSVSAPASTSVSTPAIPSVRTPASTSISTAASTSISTPASRSVSIAASISVSTATSTSISTPASTSFSTPASTSVRTPASTSISTAASTSISTPASRSVSIAASISVCTATSTSISTPASTSVSTPASTSVGTPASASVSKPARTSNSTPASTSVSTPASTTISTPARKSISTPASTSVSKVACTSISTPARQSISTPASTSVSIPASTSVSTPVSAPATTSVSKAASTSISTPASTSVSTPASTSVSTPASTSVSTPASTIVKDTIQVMECPICGYCYREDDNMKLHLARNHQISCHEELKKVPFNSKCKFCAVGFTTVQAYNKHITMFHREIWCKAAEKRKIDAVDETPTKRQKTDTAEKENSVSTAASTSVSAPASTSASAPASTSVSTPASTSVSTPASTPVTTPASTSVRTLARTSFSTPASASVSAPASTSVSAPASTSVSTPASTSVSAPASTSVSTPASTSVSTPASTSVSTPASTIVKDTIQVMECPICGYCYREDDNMKLHLARNHDISCHDELKKVPFNPKCKFCAVGFTTVQAYNKHITMFHREIWCKAAGKRKIDAVDETPTKRQKTDTAEKENSVSTAASTSVSAPASTSASAPASTSVSIAASTSVSTPASTSVSTAASTIVNDTIQVMECPICGYCLKDDDNMKLHLARNHDISCHDELKKVPFNSKCKFCDVGFTTVQARNMHITVFHREMWCKAAEKRKIDAVDETPTKRQKTDTAENKKIMYYCTTCELFSISNQRNHLHVSKMCKKFRKSKPCIVCGLIFCAGPALSFHFALHKDHDLGLKDFTFVSRKTLQPIVPSLPNFPKCTKCGTKYVSQRRHYCLDPTKRCMICNEKFNKLGYKLHMLHHKYLQVPANKSTERNKFYKCSCGLHFPSQETIERHFNVCSPDNTISSENCSRCGLLFPTDQLVNHLCKHHSSSERQDRAFQIITLGAPRSSRTVVDARGCNTKVSVRDISREEIKDMNTDHQTLFKCEQCDLHYLNISTIRSHLEVNHKISRDVKSTCDICGLKFTHSSLLKHQKHHSDNLFDLSNLRIIPVASEDFLPKNIESGRAALNTNQVTKDKTKKVVGTKTHKLYKCGRCGVHYTKESTLLEHFYSGDHNHKFLCECKFCGLIIPRMGTFHHMAYYHVKLSYFKFKVLEYESAAALNAGKLKKVYEWSTKPHTKQTLSPRQKAAKRPVLYKCEKCSLYFLTEAGSLTHINFNHITTNQRECEICGLKFGNKALQRHIELHHEKKKYSLKDFQVFKIDRRGRKTLIDDDINNKFSGSNRVQLNLEDFEISENVNENERDSDDVSLTPNQNNNNDSQNPCQKRHYLKEVKHDAIFGDNLVYKCSSCNICFMHHRSLERHFNVQHAIKRSILTCRHCDLRFTDISLSKHENIHHDGRKFKRNNLSVRECNEESFRTELKMTSLNDASISDYIDDSSDSNISGEITSQNNARVSFDNTSNGPLSEKGKFKASTGKTYTFLYKCTKCEKHFLKLCSLKKHIYLDKHSRGFPCSDCGFTFSKISLGLHVALHHKKMNLTAKDFCVATLKDITTATGKSRTSRASRESVGEDHRPDTSNRAVGSNKTLYKCSECPKHFINLKTVQRHIALGLHKPSFTKKCEICGYLFTKKGLFLHHKEHHRKGDEGSKDFEVVVLQSRQGINEPVDESVSQTGSTINQSIEPQPSTSSSMLASPSRDVTRPPSNAEKSSSFNEIQSRLDSRMIDEDISADETPPLNITSAFNDGTSKSNTASNVDISELQDYVPGANANTMGNSPYDTQTDKEGRISTESGTIILKTEMNKETDVMEIVNENVIRHPNTMVVIPNPSTMGEVPSDSRVNKDRNISTKSVKSEIKEELDVIEIDDTDIIQNSNTSIKTPSNIQVDKDRNICIQSIKENIKNESDVIEIDDEDGFQNSNTLRKTPSDIQVDKDHNISTQPIKKDIKNESDVIEIDDEDVIQKEDTININERRLSIASMETIKLELEIKKESDVIEIDDDDVENNPGTISDSDHKLSTETKIQSDIIEIDDDDTHACSCGKVFGNETAKKIHENLHHLDEAKECPICEKSFNASTLNKLHLKINRDMFVCCVCNDKLDCSSINQHSDYHRRNAARGSSLPSHRRFSH